MAMLAILILPLSILGFTAIAAVLPAGLAGLGECRAARLQRDTLCLHLRDRKQRQRLRRASPPTRRSTTRPRPGDVHRPLPDDRADARDRRIAGRQEDRAASAGTFPTDGAAVRRPAHRRDRDRRRADILPRAGPRADRRAFRDARRQALLTRELTMSKVAARARASSHASLDPAILGPAIGEAVRASSTRALMAKNPVMFVVEIVAALTTLLFAARPRRRRGAHSASPSRSACGCGSPWCSPTSPRRWPRAAARRRRRRCARCAPRRWPSASPTPTRRTAQRFRRRELKRGDMVLVEAGDLIPGDGEIVEGIASVDESAITGESAPVIRESRRRSLRGHRRHARAVRLDQGAHHRGAGLDVPRPHDRAGRGRGAAEDAERDRAEHPARRPDDHFRRSRSPLSRASPPMPAAPSRWWCWWRCSWR